MCISSPSARSAIGRVFGSTDSPALSHDKWAIFYIFLVRLLLLHVDSADGASHDDAAHRGDLHDHIGYVRSLPRSVPIPLLFRRRELDLLAATPLHGATLDKLRQTDEEHDTILKWLHGWRTSVQPGSTGSAILDGLDRLVDRAATLSLYRWSNAVSLSRAFPPTLLPSLSPDDGPVLIPALDLPNHARSMPVTWSAQPASPPCTGPDNGDAGDARVVFTTRYPIAATSEVLNNYGPKSNEELLGSYAFVLPGGQDDFLTLKLGQRQGDAGEEGAEGEAKRHQLEAGTYRWLRSSSAPPPGLIDEVRARIQLAAPDPAPRSSSPPQKFEDDEREREREVEELELHGETLETLEVLLVQKRKSFRTIQAQIEEMLVRIPPQETGEEEEGEADEDAPVRRKVWDMVDVYRQGQLTILNQAIKWTRSQLEIVADKLDQLDPAPNSDDDDDDDDDDDEMQGA
ncbi:uncharacterized protein PSFLO_06323 [Pseudozyma flocculosa]|uniref:SET domain-containing protein n=2 Tax=Pseudozyma flocculosa TaxID=84751 RepID=A0A5C3FBH8_9BASI|nr:uncharacterized protein PSFLO_06323 [Pseudozyma flocculosa]